MKARILSDLHLEHTEYEPKSLPSCGEDLVVLAGDIGEGIRGIQWAIAAIPDRPVVYVLGNHEYYREDWDLLRIKARECAAGTNVHVLEDQAIELHGVRILGCSLWTDFRSQGELVRSFAMAVAEHEMNDYRRIRKERYVSRISPWDTIRRCERSRQWLENEIDSANGPLLVVTHHAPTKRTAHPRYLLTPLNAAFHNEFDSLIRPPVAAWAHGHTHHGSQVEVNGIRVVCNPRGYPTELANYNWNFTIDI